MVGAVEEMLEGLDKGFVVESSLAMPVLRACQLQIVCLRSLISQYGRYVKPSC